MALQCVGINVQPHHGIHSLTRTLLLKQIGPYSSTAPSDVKGFTNSLMAGYHSKKSLHQEAFLLQ
jgi:hypothetical protein